MLRTVKQKSAGTDSLDSTDSSSSSDDDDEIVTVPFGDLPRDVFGMAICSLCRDFHLISKKEGSLTPRVARIVASFLKVVFTVFVQAFLLMEIKRYVTPIPVWEVRQAYSMYEKHMYDVSELNQHNHSRGISGFNASRFYDLTLDEQESVCRIPLSRPLFFGVVLFLWAVCNLTDLKISWNCIQSLVLLATPCDHMKDALVPLKSKKTGTILIVERLPTWIKSLIIVLVVLPRTAMTLRVLYIGSRWLLATTDFGELVLNAVALEFVLFLSSMFFEAFVSDRSKLDLQNTKVLCKNKQPSSLMSFVGTAFFSFVTLTWSVAYIGIPRLHEGWQTTLPDYKWDVQDVCSGWFDARFCVDPPCTAGSKSLWYYLLGH